MLLHPFLFNQSKTYISSIYRARQQEILRRYIGITVGKYETTKQGVSNEIIKYQKIVLDKINTEG